MTTEEARLLMGFENMSDEEVRQQIARDKNAMRELLRLIVKQNLTIDSSSKL